MNVKMLVGSLSYLLVAFANAENIPVNQAQSASQTNVQKFVLNLWAPDEVAPPEANLAEIGDSYQYLYSPEEIEFDEQESNRQVVFKFHRDIASRYQFRWITSTHPQYATMLKKKDGRVKIALDDGAIASEMYFEVWVYDNETGESFMCDPKIAVGGSRPTDG